jgi:hypothetical protein
MLMDINFFRRKIPVFKVLSESHIFYLIGRKRMVVLRVRAGLINEVFAGAHDVKRWTSDNRNFRIIISTSFVVAKNNLRILELKAWRERPICTFVYRGRGKCIPVTKL